MLGQWVRMAHVHDPKNRPYPYREFFGLLKGRTNIWHSKEYRDLTPRSLVTALALLG